MMSLKTLIFLYLFLLQNKETSYFHTLYVDVGVVLEMMNIKLKDFEIVFKPFGLEM
jgi:hypothetical protein